jgi:hypothetical protein
MECRPTRGRTYRGRFVGIFIDIDALSLQATVLGIEFPLLDDVRQFMRQQMPTAGFARSILAITEHDVLSDRALK